MPVKKELRKFFDYLDCNKDHFVSSEDIYKGLLNMKTAHPITTTMTNDFVLKTMEIVTATLDDKDFIHGMLVGMFERICE
jgi:hypothetical protein